MKNSAFSMKKIVFIVMLTLTVALSLGLGLGLTSLSRSKANSAPCPEHGGILVGVINNSWKDSFNRSNIGIKTSDIT